MTQKQMTLPVGATVQDSNYGDRYKVIELLGKGGTGAVYLVRDQRIKDHTLALKELIDPSNEELKRLRFECEVLKRLDHKALPHVYHVFTNLKLNRVYMLMEYIEGKNLDVLCQEQPEQHFSLELALNILTPIVQALIYMHQQNPPVVHRDIKPANIIVPLDGKEAVLVDFGTAKEYESDGTTAVFRHGSPGYAAIEQYGGGSGTDMRTDVYGLAATLYALLTGSIPTDVITRISGDQGQDALKPIHQVRADIPLPVSNAIRRAMSLNKRDRYESVEAFWHALHSAEVEELEERLHVPALPETPLPPLLAEHITEHPILTAPSGKRRTPFFTRPRVIGVLLLLITFVLIAAANILPAVLQPKTSSTSSSITKTAPIPTIKPNMPSPTATVSQAGLFPPIASSYAGTVSDLSVAHNTTAMYLKNVQQNQGHIQGFFQGLGLVGPFTGTVTTSGLVHFTVSTSANNTSLVFDGNIKVGGDIVGSFNVVDQSGQRTGEYGPWNISATP